jgi:hypothetical protein
MPVGDVLNMVSADCPKPASTSPYDRCGAHCPELPADQPRRARGALAKQDQAMA